MTKKVVSLIDKYFGVCQFSPDLQVIHEVNESSKTVYTKDEAIFVTHYFFMKELMHL
jgi:hypothetical protein